MKLILAFLLLFTITNDTYALEFTDRMKVIMKGKNLTARYLATCRWADRFGTIILNEAKVHDVIIEHGSTTLIKLNGMREYLINAQCYIKEIKEIEGTPSK